MSSRVLEYSSTPGMSSDASTRKRFDLVAVRLLALAIAPLLFAACGSASSSSGGLASSKDFKIVAYQGDEELGGKEIQFSKVFERRKPVVLNFWAGDCPPCRAEMPAFQKIADEFQGKVIFVGVDLGIYTGLGTQADARRLLEDLSIRYPAAYAADSAPLELYKVRSMPTTVLFSAGGDIAGTYPGMLLEPQLRSALQKLTAS